MTPERLRQIREIFDAAVARPETERPAFIADACAGDERLAADLRSLLAFDEVSGDVLEHVARDGGVGLRSALESFLEGGPELCGRRFGRYQLDELLGAGGMGVVYRARQEDPARAVALKIIRPGLTSPSMLRRLRVEAEMLARLHHPGVAQVFETGTADTQFGVQPFVAMEYVDGRPLNEYAETRGLEVADRLALFARICDGVEHAHQRGVIHRDLKPANILVDETGQPKIIDFGVARLTGADALTASRRQTTGGLVGTLRYMSPEQLGRGPDDVDTRSDIYTLGVVYYELLAGRPPYDVSGRGVADVARTIGETEPVPLGAIDRRLRGDVETIARKALEKDPDRRYQSASALGADVRRFLRDEPITARPASLLYHVGKFARRNRLASGAVAAALVLLVAAVAGTAFGLLRASEQRRQAERNLAEAEAAAGFLDDMLTSVRPEELGRDVLVRDVLDQAAEAIETRFADQPVVRARLHHTVGASYRLIGDLEPAERHLAEAFGLARRELGERDDRTMRCQLSLAVLLGTRGRGQEAATLARTAAEIRAETLGREHPDALGARRIVAESLMHAGELPEAEAILVDLLDSSRRVLGPEHLDVLAAMNVLAVLYGRQDRHDEAEPLLREALRLRLEVLGEAHPSTLTSMNNLAVHFGKRGDAEASQALMEQVLDARRERMGEDHPQTLTAMNNLGLAFYRQQRLDAAAPLFEAAAGGRRRVLGPDHRQTITATANLAMTAMRLGRHEQAGSLYATLVDEAVARGDGQEVMTVRYLSQLAAIRRDQGRFGEARELFERALALRRAILGPAHAETHVAMHNLATLYGDLGEFDAAEALFEAVVAARRRLIGDGHPTTLTSLNNWGRVRMARGACDRAEPLLREALEGRQKLGEGHPHALISMTDLAVLCLRVDRVKEGVELARAAHDGAVSRLGETHPILADARWALGRALAADGLDREAEPLLRSALAMRRRVYGPDHPRHGALLCDLAELAVRQARHEEAAVMLHEARELTSHGLGPDHDLTKRAEELLEELEGTKGRRDGGTKGQTGSAVPRPERSEARGSARPAGNRGTVAAVLLQDKAGGRRLAG